MGAARASRRLLSGGAVQGGARRRQGAASGSVSRSGALGAGRPGRRARCPGGLLVRA
jgi:hypothetical protein